MSNQIVKALFLGDVCGQPGCRALFMGLKQLIKDYHADVVITNGENAADGFGITPDLAEQMRNSGVDIITSGNHIWQKREIIPMLKNQEWILRPANYPPKVPGRGFTIFEAKKVKVGVLNLQGRKSLPSTDCPFRVGKDIIQQLRSKTHVIIVDFHAENTEEKEALGIYLDGQVSAVLGTHTHVQTADERILPKGTAYITDVGMTGPEMSVIGSRPDLSLERQLTQMPIKSEILDDSTMINGVLLSIDTETGKAEKIERVFRKFAF